VSVAARIPLDEISARAHQARPGRAVLTLVAGLLFGIGWLAYKAFAVAWLAIAWGGCAVTVGWQEARSARTPGPGR
jgi:hypothetical protein